MSLPNTSRLAHNLKFWSNQLNPKHSFVISEHHDLLSLLRSCNQTSETIQIHAYMIKSGLDQVPFTLSKLLASSIPDTEYAASIFRDVQNPNLFMFNTMLRCYSIGDHPKQAFVVFNHMRSQSIMLDEFSFVTILKVCARELAICTGRGIHGIVLRSGSGLFVTVKNILLHLYGVCERIGDAHKVFDEFPQTNDLVTWNTLMGGYLHMSQPIVVVDLFTQMCRRGLKASANTYSTVLSAAGDLGIYFLGQSLHGHCIKIDYCSDINVVTSLIDMFAKCGHLELGHKIFDGVTEKDVVLWNCLIDKYAKSGYLEEALVLLHLMKVEGRKPNSSTLTGLLSACAASGAINIGRCINDYVKKEGLALDVVLGTTLVDMYAKCGFIENAIGIFNEMENKDVRSWTAMITGYGIHGRPIEAIRTLYEMEKEGFQPNEITFLAVLSACSHGGLVKEGMRCFKRMVYAYSLLPKIEHYGCIIDLLGRAGLLEEAYKLMKSMPFVGDATAWRALLAASRVYGDVALGETVQKLLVELYDEHHPTDSMLLSSTYAIAGRLSDYTSRKEVSKGKRMKDVIGEAQMGEEKIKEAGYSMIELDS